MGITNFRKNGTQFELSTPFVIFNVLKICAFFSYRRKIIKNLADHFSPSYSNFIWSPFSRNILPFLYVLPFWYALSLVLLLSVTCIKNVKLINEMMNLRNLSENLLQMKIELDRSDKICVRNVLFLLILNLIIHVQDFLSSIQHTFLALVAYVILIFPYIINLSFTCYVYIIIQFVDFLQTALNSYASKNFDQNAIETIINIHASLCTFKSHFISALSLPIQLAAFYNIAQIVFQVI